MYYTESSNTIYLDRGTRNGRSGPWRVYSEHIVTCIGETFSQSVCLLLDKGSHGHADKECCTGTRKT